MMKAITPGTLSAGQTAGQGSFTGDQTLDRVLNDLLGTKPAEFRCPACGNRLRTPRAFQVRLGRCRACGIVFPVPQQTQATCLYG